MEMRELATAMSPFVASEPDVRLERFVAGDLVAFESLFHQFQSDVFGWILRIVRDRQAAEDLTAETFWRIYRARARFDPQRSFGAWARRIASNVAISFLKHNPRPFTPIIQPAVVPVDPAMRRETRETIARAFSELPPRLQVTATLALIEEQSYDDIARGLGISVGGVKSRVFRAVRILRKKLKRMGIEP
jgi:RNA polymerase sigma factor (sigma-70 family)